MFANKSSFIGGLSTGVPGEIYGYWEAHRLAGKLDWKTLFEPSIEMTRQGFRCSKILGKAIQTNEKFIRANKGLSAIFVNKATDQLYKYNDVIKMERFKI